jgi:pseudaminic acid synthase
MKIAERKIGCEYKPYLIAEMSGNHNQSLERALSIVDAAAQCGVDAIKLQTYTAKTMTLDVMGPGFIIDDPCSLWAGRQLFELYDHAHTPWEWHRPIMARAAAKGMHCFSTPFDETAVDFLEELGVPAYKIASFENTDLPLIRKVASTGKPVIISLGTANLSEIDEAVRTAREAGCQDLVLLKCTSTYPASPKDSNILTIPHLKTMYRCEVGLSDHTMGIGTAIAAIAHGASVVEKHLTLKRSDGGVDSIFSLEPDEFADLVVEGERAWQSLGAINYGPTLAEKKSVQFRRSLYITEDMQAGDSISHSNMRCLRPGLGLPPKYLDIIIGRRVNINLKKGTPVSWEIFK